MARFLFWSRKGSASPGDSPELSHNKISPTYPNVNLVVCKELLVNPTAKQHFA